jgi:hypothetical protein
MVLHQAVNVYRIIAFNEKGRPYLTFDNNNLINSLFNNIVAGSDETHIAFKKMIKFMCDNRNCNDAMRLSKAFFVCEKEDDFEDLYYSDILNLIASRFTQTFDGKFRFRKPNPLRDKTLEKIIEYKRMGSFDLSFSDLEQKFIKKAFSDKQKLINARDLETFLKEHTLEQILHKLFYVKYKNLLEGDYLDLFNRFM